jgi:hypothetical protein
LDPFGGPVDAMLGVEADERGDCGVPAKIDFDRGGEPAQLQIGSGFAGGAHEAGFGLSEFARDLLHLPGGETIRADDDGCGVA